MRRSLVLLSRVSKSRPITPPALRPAHERPLRFTKPTPESNSAEATEATIQPTRNRKPLIYAIGFAVVTVAGAIFGAQLKNTKQEHDKRKVIEAAAEELATTAFSTPSLQLQKQKAESVTAGQSLKPSAAQRSHYTVDVAKQIALLEDRKALLNRQRLTLEGKIVKLKERRVKKAQMEARRAGGIGGINEQR